jgi:hypothetical protein
MMQCHPTRTPSHWHPGLPLIRVTIQVPSPPELSIGRGPAAAPSAPGLGSRPGPSRGPRASDRRRLGARAGFQVTAPSPRPAVQDPSDRDRQGRGDPGRAESPDCVRPKLRVRQNLKARTGPARKGGRCCCGC